MHCSCNASAGRVVDAWSIHPCVLSLVAKEGRSSSSRYLVDRACPLVVVDMAVERQVHPVLLPELLEALPGHGLRERAVDAVEEAGGVAEDAVRDEHQPRLLLPVDRGEAALDELVLLRAFPPVVLAVRHAEPEHAVVCRVPVDPTRRPQPKRSKFQAFLSIYRCVIKIDRVALHIYQ